MAGILRLIIQAVHDRVSFDAASDTSGVAG